MAGKTKTTSAALRMIALGQNGPAFRPEQDYFSISLVSLHLPGRFLNASKFAPVVWASLKADTSAGGSLVGLFPPADAAKPQFARNDRVEVVDMQLTPRIIAREEMTIDFTLGAIREKDYIGGVLGIVTELAATPAAGYLSQVVPQLAMVKDGVQFADKLNKKLSDLLDLDKLQAFGKYLGTLRAPMQSGLFAFTDSRAETKNITWNEGDNCLMTSAGPMKSAYAVLRFQREEFRPDWQSLPDVLQAWTRIREAALGRADILGAIDFFRVTAVTSPDLTAADANRLVDAARKKFAHVLDADHAAEGAFMLDDPGDIGDALDFFMQGDAESAEISSDGQVSTFDSALAIVLDHEGGYVNHPADPGGATNKGVTQRTYDAYRAHVSLDAQTVAAITPEEIRAIYYRGYWLPARCAEMPAEALAIFMFDTAVNHGAKPAIKMLQQAAGVADRDCDGKWGATTNSRILTASSNLGVLVETCLQKREAFYRRLVELKPPMAVFLKGWLNRIVKLRNALQPYLVRAGVATDTESALIIDEGDQTPLVAAPPDFSEWEVAPAMQKAAE